MINHVRKFYILPLMLAGIMCSCSPGGESPNPPNSNSSRQAQQTAPQAPQSTVVQQPVAATPKVVVEPQPQPVAPANAPKLFVATTRVDFGKQPMDKTINRTIVLKNVGKSDLKIESVVPS